MNNLKELLEKEKKLALKKYLRIPIVQVLFRYHVLLLRYFTGTEKPAFQAKYVIEMCTIHVKSIKECS